MKKLIVVLMGLGLCGRLSAQTAESDSSIVTDGDAVRLKAGVLERVIRVSGGDVATESLTVSGTSLIAGPADELSLRITRAEPNRNPLELPIDSGGPALNVAEAKANDTDALKVSGKTKTEPKPTAGQVRWIDGRTFSAASWGQVFDLTNVAITQPHPGTQRVVIRSRSLKDPLLAGVSVNLLYEVYEGYPVIRKWVEIHNNSANWLKLDNLLTDNLKLCDGFARDAELTPSERGATSSILAFSQADNTKGVIIASEVPSALRVITEHGASGYNPEFFEWVIGPAESFVSEPTFLFGFNGEVIKTASAESLPLDRAVEGRFRDFLGEHLGISPAHARIAAPLWCSWTNFGHRIDDALIREQADIAAKCGFAVIQLDDGWQQDRLGTTPDPKKFPDFNATCDYIRSKGMRLGLWVSCFRSRAADDFKALPDAAISPEVQRLDGVAMSFASRWNQYYANDLVYLHDRYGATYFKQDFPNIQFGDLAAGHQSRTRKESLLRGLRGLLESQTLLRKLAPDVANEITHEIYWGTPGTPCDLAALKHVSLYHIPPNDYSGCGDFKERPHDGWSRYSVEALREQLLEGCLNARNRFYAHRGLPLECVEYYGAASVNWQGSLTPQIQDRQVCSWLMGAPTVYVGDLASLTEENIVRYRSRFDILKRLETTYGIYRRFQYSGIPAPTDADWHWWGKLDARGCGAVVVLRGSGGKDRRDVNIPWVDPVGNYKVAALLEPRKLGTFTGRQLQAGELTLALPPLGQEILELSPANE
jgi:alpha-galactosidase